MKKVIYILLLTLLASCTKESINFPTTDCYWNDIGINHPKNDLYQDVIDEFTAKGLPGVNLLIDREGEELWVGASGVSRIENQQAMEPCNIMPAGSVGKLFCATAAMLMVEDGLLELDKTIDNYLPAGLVPEIPNSSSASIANLLSHTSGIPDYMDNPNAMLDLLNNKNMDFSREAILEKFIYGKSPKFEPGSACSYSHSNYELLTIIMDQVYPDGHVDYYEYRIFGRLGLYKTWYQIDTTYLFLHERGMANGYFDRYSDGILENATDVSLTIASGQTGSDGVITNVVDLHTLLKSVMEARIVDAETLDLMKEYINQKSSSPTDKYGLGLVYRDFGEYGIAIGHPGSSPGYTTEAWYFPEYDSYIVYQINAGNLLAGPVQELIDKEFRDAILAEVFEN